MRNTDDGGIKQSVKMENVVAGRDVKVQQHAEQRRSESLALFGAVWEELQQAGLDEAELGEARAHLVILDDQLQLPEPDKSLLTRALGGLEALGEKVLAVLRGPVFTSALSAAASRTGEALVKAWFGVP